MRRTTQAEIDEMWLRGYDPETTDAATFSPAPFEFEGGSAPASQRTRDSLILSPRVSPAAVRYQHQ